MQLIWAPFCTWPAQRDAGGEVPLKLPHLVVNYQLGPLLRLTGEHTCWAIGSRSASALVVWLKPTILAGWVQPAYGHVLRSADTCCRVPTRVKTWDRVRTRIASYEHVRQLPAARADIISSDIQARVAAVGNVLLAYALCGGCEVMYTRAGGWRGYQLTWTGGRLLRYSVLAEQDFEG